jgi:hypothetical protein
MFKNTEIGLIDDIARENINKKINEINHTNLQLDKDIDIYDISVKYQIAYIRGMGKYKNTVLVGFKYTIPDKGISTNFNTKGSVSYQQSTAGVIFYNGESNYKDDVKIEFNIGESSSTFQSVYNPSDHTLSIINKNNQTDVINLTVTINIQKDTYNFTLKLLSISSPRVAFKIKGQEVIDYLMSPQEIVDIQVLIYQNDIPIFDFPSTDLTFSVNPSEPNICNTFWDSNNKIIKVQNTNQTTAICYLKVNIMVNSISSVSTLNIALPFYTGGVLLSRLKSLKTEPLLTTINKLNSQEILAI